MILQTTWSWGQKSYTQLEKLISLTSQYSIQLVILGGIDIVSRLKLVLVMLVAIIILSGCNTLEAEQALQLVAEAKSYYAEYKYTGFEGKTVAVKEWYLAPNNLYQQISYADSVSQQVWVHKGQTTILNASLDEVFIIQREVVSQLLQLYRESTEKVTMHKEEGYYLLSAESVAGLKITIKCDKTGRPLLIEASSNKLEKEYTVTDFKFNCRIKESMFKKGTD